MTKETKQNQTKETTLNQIEETTLNQTKEPVKAINGELFITKDFTELSKPEQRKIRSNVLDAKETKINSIKNSKKPMYFIFDDGSTVSNEAFSKLEKNKQEELKKASIEKYQKELKKREEVRNTEKAEFFEPSKDKEIQEELKGVNQNQTKEFDIAQAKKLNEKNMSEPEKFIYKYLFNKVSNFDAKAKGKYILQCSSLLKNTSFIFIKNSNETRFTDKNTFNIINIANVLKTLAFKKIEFLALQTTKNNNDFNIVKVADNLEEYKKRYNIEPTPKNKPEPEPETNENQKEDVASSSLDNMSREDIINYCTEILTSENKATNKLKSLETLFNIKKNK